LTAQTFLFCLFAILPFIFSPSHSQAQSQFDDDSTLVFYEDLALRDELNTSIDRFTKVDSAKGLKTHEFTFSDRTVGHETIVASLTTFKRIINLVGTQEELNRLLRKYYEVYRVTDRGQPAEAIITGYYIPHINVQREKTSRFRHPIYRKPSSTRLSRQFTRQEIDQENMLTGLDLEIAYTDDLLALFFMHIQGTGILKYTDGHTLYANNNGTNDKTFYSISKDLIRDGKLDLKSKGSISDKIAAYFKLYPEDLEKYLYKNDRYVFFKMGQDGPFGLGKYILTPLRSIAADTDIFPPGSLIYIVTDIPDIGENGSIKGWKPLHQFFICQDTGIAIKGMHRIDLFFGSGEMARKKAEYIYRKGQLFVLLLKNKAIGE
jgi:membrane-bound lytic murein transglycosylase A